jgi:peptidoglycan/xylan/chitin deacetylase (PgdA/CDA1 family)
MVPGTVSTIDSSHSPSSAPPNRFWMTTLPSQVLTYHIIAPKASRYLYSASCEQFEEHLKMICELSSARSTGAPVVTFDDGALSDFEFALPLLEKHKVRAIFFITAGLIENTKGFMNWPQVREIESLGHSVQSHGWSHVLLTRANQASLLKELEGSKKTLEDRLGRQVESLSLPGGRWNARALAACTEAGYRAVYHSNPWKIIETDVGLIFTGRLMVRNSMKARQLNDILCGKRRSVMYYRMQYLLKEAGKGLVGDKLYHSLWRGLARITR